MTSVIMLTNLVAVMATRLLVAITHFAPGLVVKHGHVVVTRKIFLGIGPVGKAIFYVLAILVIAIFAYGWIRRVKKYRKGRPAQRKLLTSKAKSPVVVPNLDHLEIKDEQLDIPLGDTTVSTTKSAQVQNAGSNSSNSSVMTAVATRPTLGQGIENIASNKTIKSRNKGVGHAHFLVFWGMIMLFIATSIVSLDYDVYRNLTYLFTGVERSFYKGTFYLWYKVIFNTAGILTLVGVLSLMFRRKNSGEPQLDYTRAEKPKEGYSRKSFVAGDWLFMGLIAALIITGFFIEALRIDGTKFPPFETWSWVGWLLAKGLYFVGVGSSAALSAHKVLWWIHAAMAFFFVAYLPFSKAMHIFTAAANLVVTDPGSARRLPKPPESSDHVGYQNIKDFTWKELLDFDSCTKCGRCHYACPARTVGGPLSPRDLILDLRQWVDRVERIPMVLDWEERPEASGPVLGSFAKEIAGDVIKEKTLWSCTSCMACVEACPVGIEHVSIIVQLRRRLVDQGNMEPSLQKALQNISQQGNSFGKSARMRSRWTKGAGVEIKDARKEPVKYLWFVGDFASFDERYQALSQTLAKVLTEADVSFGLLNDGERNAGNDVRRIGEEGLFEMLVEQNLASFASASFEKIFTTDPHSLNTLRNEYPLFGLEKPVQHYTELLMELLESNAIPVKSVGKNVTYHDPCYLGRYNRVFDAPRNILKATGCNLIEMPRNKENSFCCGAGGGRVWMDDSYLDERPSENRIKEAVQLEVDYFVVACPKDFAMYSDAVKTTGNEDKIQVIDIIQIIDEAFDRSVLPEKV